MIFFLTPVFHGQCHNLIFTHAVNVVHQDYTRVRQRGANGVTCFQIIF